MLNSRKVHYITKWRGVENKQVISSIPLVRYTLLGLISKASYQPLVLQSYKSIFCVS